MMKLHITHIALLTVLLAACQKPTEVQLTSESLLEVENVNEPDPSVERTSVDSTALLPNDQERFAGLVTIASVKTATLNGVEAKAFARVAFESRMRPLIIGGRKVFFHLPLGTVAITHGGNSDLLFPRERRMGGQSFGLEYVREITNFVHQGVYRITSSGSDSVSAFSVQVESPQDLIVQAPTAGRRVARNQDATLRWSGQGNLVIIVSALEQRNGDVRVIPLMSLKPRRNATQATVSKRILGALPPGSYVLTFVLANRSEQTVGRFQGRVLVQASSIFNVRVELI